MKEAEGCFKDTVISRLAVERTTIPNNFTCKNEYFVVVLPSIRQENSHRVLDLGFE